MKTGSLFLECALLHQSQYALILTVAFSTEIVVYWISGDNENPAKITMTQKAKSLTLRDGIQDLLIANKK